MLTPAQEERLADILAGSGKLSEWESNFLTSLAKQYEDKGPETIVTPKMWATLERISEKQ